MSLGSAVLRKKPESPSEAPDASPFGADKKAWSGSGRPYLFMVPELRAVARLRIPSQVELASQLKPCIALVDELAT